MPDNFPKLSIVVVAYEMARELPRTVLSLSTAMQVGISEEEYEIIVVDNGSGHAIEEDDLRRLAPNIQLITVKSATPSPVQAIHLGIEASRGDLLGVWIDGARMASPGLLMSAINASKAHPNPVIGTYAFHLGPKIQTESILDGYCQALEDKLLSEIGWQEDGYRLFDIACFAGSSRGGWFSMPAETNALFMKRSEWRQMDGGYDKRFLSPGGGLANLDLWKRLAEDDHRGIIMLLGEGTFHQVHGGVATNARSSPWPEFSSEYAQIRGRPYVQPLRSPLFWGAFNSHSRRLL